MPASSPHLHEDLIAKFRVRAVRAYLKCRDALETELGIEPGLPLKHLYREIKPASHLQSP